MTARNPLVLVGGSLRELPTGDMIPAASTGVDVLQNRYVSLGEQVSLSAAASLATTLGRELVIDAAVALATSLTIACAVRFTGGKITLGLGVSLTLSGAITPLPAKQCFDLGTGAAQSSYLIAPKIGAVTPQMFGAPVNGTDDDWQGAENARVTATNSKKPLFWLTGSYRLSKGLDLRGCPHVVGESRHDVKIVCTDKSGPIFKWGNLADGVFGNFTAGYDADCAGYPNACALELSGAGTTATNGVRYSGVGALTLTEVYSGIRHATGIGIVNDFSNSFRDIRIVKWRGYALSIHTTSIQNTQNLWSNIYLSNTADDGSFRTCLGYLDIDDTTEITFDTVNFEHARPSDDPVKFGPNVTLSKWNNVHIEGVHMERVNGGFFNFYGLTGAHIFGVVSAQSCLVGRVTLTDVVADGSATISSASAGFGTWAVGAPVTLVGAGPGGADLSTTVLSSADATHVTLAAAPSLSASGVTARFGAVSASKHAALFQSWGADVSCDAISWRFNKVGNNITTADSVSTSIGRMWCYSMVETTNRLRGWFKLCSVTGVSSTTDPFDLTTSTCSVGYPVYDGVVSGAGTTLASASAAWLTAHVGRSVYLSYPDGTLYAGVIAALTDTHTATISPAAPTGSGLPVLVGTSTTLKDYVLEAPSGRRQIRPLATVWDQGDSNYVHYVGRNRNTLRFRSALTAKRTVTLDLNDVYDNAEVVVEVYPAAVYPVSLGGLYDVPAGFAARARYSTTDSLWRFAGLWQLDPTMRPRFKGAGAPTLTAAQGAVKGDYYDRTDTPTVANQRTYVFDGAAWLGIL